LINNHPFTDGNKRTGILSAAIFIAINGYRLTADNPELENFTLRVADQHLPMNEMATWFERNSTN